MNDKVSIVSERAASERLMRYTLTALIVGAFLGAGSAVAVNGGPKLIPVASAGTVWGEYHAAIPHDTISTEHAPTF